MDLTRAELEREVRTYGGFSRSALPKKYKSPDNEKDFNIGLAIYFADSETVQPIYDSRDVLVGWKGIEFR